MNATLLLRLLVLLALLLPGSGQQQQSDSSGARVATTCDASIAVTSAPPFAEFIEHGNIRLIGVFSSDCGYDTERPLQLTVTSLQSGLSNSFELPRHAKVETQFDPQTGHFTWACDGEFRLGEGLLLLQLTGRTATGSEVVWVQAIESGSEFDDYSQNDRWEARQNFGFRSMVLFDTYARFIERAVDWGVDPVSFPQVELDQQLLELARQSWVVPMVQDPDCSHWRTTGESQIAALEELLAQYPITSPADDTYKENLITGAHAMWASMGWEQDSEANWLLRRFYPPTLPRRIHVPPIFRAVVDALNHTFPDAEITTTEDSLILALRYYADEGTPFEFSGTADVNAGIFPTPIPGTAFSRPPVTEIIVTLTDSDTDDDLDAGTISGYRVAGQPVVKTELHGHLVTGLSELVNSPYFSPG